MTRDCSCFHPGGRRWIALVVGEYQLSQEKIKNCSWRISAAAWSEKERCFKQVVVAIRDAEDEKIEAEMEKVEPWLIAFKLTDPSKRPITTTRYVKWYVTFTLAKAVHSTHKQLWPLGLLHIQKKVDEKCPFDDSTPPELQLFNDFWEWGKLKLKNKVHRRPSSKRSISFELRTPNREVQSKAEKIFIWAILIDWLFVANWLLGLFRDSKSIQLHGSNNSNSNDLANDHPCRPPLRVDLPPSPEAEKFPAGTSEVAAHWQPSVHHGSKCQAELHERASSTGIYLHPIT